MFVCLFVFGRMGEGDKLGKENSHHHTASFINKMKILFLGYRDKDRVRQTDRRTDRDLIYVPEMCTRNCYQLKNM